MHELYELKEKLSKELKSYGKKGEITASTLTMIDTLAHALKNLDKVIEKCEEEEEYSMRPSFESGSMRGSYEGSSGYSRGYSREGSYRRRRDSMGRYSRDGYSNNDEIISQLEDIMRNAPDDRTRKKIQEIMEKM